MRSLVPPQAQSSGALARTSPSRRERLGSAAMPVRNSSEKPAIAASEHAQRGQALAGERDLQGGVRRRRSW